jgi:hypothetical protein
MSTSHSPTTSPTSRRRAVSNLKADPPLGVMIVKSDDGGRLLDLLDAWFFAQGD